MAMSAGVRIGTMVTGYSLLVLTFISVICGGVAMTKLTKPAAVSLGLWGLYFPIPALISIFAGYKKHQSLLPVALGTQVVGIILGVVGLTVGATYWQAIQDSNCEVRYDYSYYDYDDFWDPRRNPHCFCRDSLVYSEKSYPITCWDLKIVRECTSAVTIIFILFVVVTLVGSIYGCIGTCCAPRPREQTDDGVLLRNPQANPVDDPAVYLATYPNPAHPGTSHQPPAYDQLSGQVQMPVVENKT